MVHKFSRSISFPLSPRLMTRRASYHVRSVSLSCRSHPFITNLEEQIRVVGSCVTRSDLSIETGLIQIEQLHGALNEFLNLSETKNTLSGSVSMDSVLEDFLNLADSYGSFLSMVVTLKQQLSEVQSAYRSRDTTWLASSLRSQKKIEKELIIIASQLRAVCRSSNSMNSRLGSNASEAETFGILKEAINAVILASVAVFSKIASISANASSAASGSLKKRILKEEKDTIICDKFEELEECVKIAENQSEKIFRSTVKSRVLLLNIRSGLF